MLTKQLLSTLPAALLFLGIGTASAGSIIEETGALVCVTDKWDEKEPEKGHKLVDYASRCVIVPHDTAAAKADPDARPLTAKQLKAMVPLRALRGRPKSASAKQLVSVRYSPEVLAYFKSTGEGWQARMDVDGYVWLRRAST